LPTEAIGDFTQAIRLDPKYAFAYRARGDAYLAQANYAQAIANYGEAIRLDYKYATALSQRARCYYADKQYFKALSDCEDAMRISPETVAAYNICGCVYLALKEYDKAIDKFLAANQRNPQDVKVLNNLGVAYEGKNDWPAAIKCYNAALEINADDVVGLHNRGVAYLRSMGEKTAAGIEHAAGKVVEGESKVRIPANLDKACDDLLKAVAIAPKDANIRYDLGIAYFLQEKYDLAKQQFDEALRIKPDFSNARNYRDQCLKLLPKKSS
jgi:tetratricopeptide (TPR) repeat protein